MKNKINRIFIIIFFSYLQILKSEGCNQSTPILKRGNCELVYCTESEFNLGNCSVNNTIIKTQWLNNIISVGETNFRFLNFITTSNNITFMETSAHPDSTYERIIFGIKEDGSAFFEDSSGNKNYIIKKKIPNNKEKYESEAGYIKINSNDINYKDKDYIITIGKSSTYTEILNINNLNEEFQLFQTTTFIGATTETYISSTINLTEDDIHYFFFAAIKQSSSGYLFSLNKFKFQIESGSNEISYSKVGDINYQITNNRRMVTCFISEKKIIVCFYYSKTYSKYGITLLNTNLTKVKTDDDYLESGNDGSYFYKCIHFKKEIGIFVYFLGSSEESIMIKILEIADDYSLNNYIVNFVDSLSAISSNNQYSFNDIIKLTEYQICYASCNKNKDTLIIELINFYGQKNYNIRYYVIPIFKLYKIKFLWEIRMQRYNQHAAFAFSFCKQDSCKDDATDTHYSSLLIFSYPNITDKNISLNQIFYEKNINYLSVNLTEYAIIDNNIFGLVIYGIKIKGISSNQIKLISTKYSKEINNDDIIVKDDIIKIKSTNGEYNEMNIQIKYQLIITEPDIKEYNKYPTYIYKENDSDENSNFIRINYGGKIGSYNIIIDSALTENCKSVFCNLCFKNDTNYCVVCKRNYTFETNENYSNFKKCEETEIEEEPESETEIEEETEAQIKSQKESEIIEGCSIEMIIENKCKNESISSEEYKAICKYLENNLANWKEFKENIIIETTNVTIQMSSYNDQKLGNINISSIDLGQCENYLKKTYNIEEDLFVIKTDIRSEDLTKTYVQYKIYNPNDLKEFNLNECSDITINTPIYFDNEIETLYNSLNKSGYNLFDPNDPFYNDVCTPYTTLNDTDIILNDRKQIHLKYCNISLCQTNCRFVYYSSDNKKASCKCNSQNFITDIQKIDFSELFKRETISDAFLKTIKNSNFLVLKCYKYAIDLKTIITNIGRIIMTLLLIIFVIIMVIHFTVKKNEINNIIINLVNKKYELFKNNNDKLKNKNKNKINKKEINKINFKTNNNNNSKKKNIKESDKIKFFTKNNPPKTNKKKNKTKIPNTGQILQLKKNVRLSNESFIAKNGEKDISGKKISFSGMSEKRNIKISKRKNIIETYNDQELNTMSYKDALKNDKRTYFQYYFSLLKRKQLLLFTFWPNNDYNLFFIKIDLFLISFSLYFTINGFFFDDKTMNKIYSTNGNYSILLQINQILLSSIISVFFNVILKLLALSEKDILSLKKISEYNEARKKSKNVIKYLKLKFIIFFTLSTLILFFFWYFIACFCGIFVNTQILLIKDTFTSFAISMIYPFIINLIPGILRIIALRDNKGTKNIIYKISMILALI